MSKSPSRLCAKCKGALRETRPVFLVSDGSGRIVGPYHASCAAAISESARARNRRGPTQHQQGVLLGFDAGNVGRHE